MPGRVKLTTQAVEEHVPGNSPKKRAASAPAAASAVKKAKVTPTSSTRAKTLSVAAAAPPTKKPKPSREKTHACTYPGCDKLFVRPCRLEEHLRSHTGERPYKCTADPENCDKSFLRESHLKAHVKGLHLKEKPLKCTFMIPPGSEDDRGVFGFKRKASENWDAPRGDGSEDEDEDEEGALKECGAGFRTNQQLKRHMESHMKTMPHICTEYPPCSAGFRKRGPLRRHIRTVHLNVLPWACQLQDIDDPSKPCTAAFDTKGKLGGHIDIVHKRMSPALFTCAMCMASTNDGASLQVPEGGSPRKSIEEAAESPAENAKQNGDDRIDDNIGSTQDLGGSGASTPFPIIRSVLVPDPTSGTASDPNTARLQGRLGFKTYRELRRHIAEVHPPACKHCGYICKSGRNLNNHIKNSHGADVNERRIYPCKTCDATFTRRHALKVHIKCVHEHLRPFVCTHAPCTKTYGYKAQLERHIENHHSGRKPKPRKPRKKSTKTPGLIQQLTGIGYEESGRDIKCVVEECPYRFCRMYDLRCHLGSLKHGFTDGQVDELMIDAERATGGDNEETDNEEETDEDGSSGTESDEDEHGVGMGYAEFWDSMSDMDISSGMDNDKDNE